MDDVTNRLQELGIASDIGQANIRTSQVHNSLTEALRRIQENVQSTSERVEKVEASTDPRGLNDAHQLTLLHEQAKELATLANNLVGVTERCVIDRIISLGEPGQYPIPQLLKHFDQHINHIAKRVLSTDNTETPFDIMWRIAEECYKEAAIYDGKLHSNDFFIPLEETLLGSPYDADFESEAYYEHEDRLDLDPNYARAYFKKRQRQEEQKTMERKRWPEFWARLLSRCPAGPTLFYQKSIRIPRPQTPRYLFRAFDAESSGCSNENFVFSTMFPGQEPCNILELDPVAASKMLHGHLNKRTHAEAGTKDNLMSWSSSLVFVIQYAIWRASKRNLAHSEVLICAVDTTKFPAEQFARDMWLIEVFRETWMNDEGQRYFFNFRLTDPKYDNGEYLSQGLVTHRGRSCTFSLEQLEQVGLYKLYPEFRESNERVKWTNKVKDLRLDWDPERTTAPEDLTLATNIARDCFGTGFDLTDVAMLVLAFKNRKLKLKKPVPIVTEQDVISPGPVETCRSIEWARMVKANERCQSVSTALDRLFCTTSDSED